LAAVCLALAVAACGHDHAGHESESHDPVSEALEEACAHIKNGPSQAVTLTPDAAGAPDLSKAHTRLDITFAKLAGGGMGGVGVYKAGAAGDYVFGLSSEVSVTVSDKNDAPVAAEQALTKPAACAEFASAAVFELGVGSYTVHFHSPGDTGVKAVFSRAGESHAH